MKLKIAIIKIAMHRFIIARYFIVSHIAINFRDDKTEWKTLPLDDVINYTRRK